MRFQMSNGAGGPMEETGAVAREYSKVLSVNIKQLRETKIEDAKSRGKIVSISLCLSPSLSL
jgi:hypothetical protein